MKLLLLVLIVLGAPSLARADDGAYVPNAHSQKLDRVRQLKTTAADALSTTTNSASGLELLSQNYITMLQGCGDAQVLAWSESNDYWQCADSGAGAGDITAVGDITSGAAFTAGTPGKTLVWNNATSGTITMEAVAGALGTRTLSLPAETGTIALTANTLGDFAATTSSQLAAVLSDEAGSGVLTFATSPTLTTPVLAGTPAGAAALGYNTTQAMNATYGGVTAVAAPLHATISTGVGTQTLTNSTASDQDFTTAYTFPANSIYTNKVYRVTYLVETVTGVSAVTLKTYLKLGSTKVYLSTGGDLNNSATRSHSWVFLIFGRAAAGAAANVTTAGLTQNATTISGSSNTTGQPVALATNGTLALTLGVTYDGTGSTETVEQQGFLVEELN
jgi:hypothetical protein